MIQIREIVIAFGFRMKGLKSYWNVIRWRMFTFTLPFVVANVPRTTRAFEWCFGISALRIQYFSTGMALVSTLIDIWKVRSNIKHCWSNDSNQRNRDCIRICHAAKILHLPWALHWTFHLRLMLLVIPDTLLSIFSSRMFINVYRRIVSNTWQISPQLNYTGITACCENTISALFPPRFVLLASLLISFV